MHFARTIDADPDQETVLLEELRPRIVDHGAVGLNRIVNRLVGMAIFASQLDRALEERQSHEGRFAALPRDVDIGGAMRLNELAT